MHVEVPQGWEKRGESPSGWAVYNLRTDRVKCWAAEASICQLPFSIESQAHLRAQEGLGLPNRFQVLDERTIQGWNYKLFQVKGTPDVYLQLMAEGKAIVCNFRLIDRHLCSSARLTAALPNLDKELRKICAAFGFHPPRLIFGNDGLLQIGDGWGVRL